METLLHLLLRCILKWHDRRDRFLHLAWVQLKQYNIIHVDNLFFMYKNQPQMSFRT